MGILRDRSAVNQTLIVVAWQWPGQFFVFTQ